MPRETLKDRFWTLTRRKGECIIWMGRRDKRGYGKLGNGSAYRWAYEQARGPVPEGLQLDHLCNNPSCVNPSHLKPVTPRENVLRGASPPAINARKTHCGNGHEFTPENTYNWNGWRFCRACNRATTARRRAA